MMQLLRVNSLLLKNANDFHKTSFMDVSQGLNPLSPKLTKWSNTLKQSVGCVFDHFVELALKRLNMPLL